MGGNSQGNTGEGVFPPPVIVVDLDGTLTPTDTLIESIIQLVKRSPADLLRCPFWLLGGRAAFKEMVARRAILPVEHLPYRETLLGYLRGEKEKGRRIILATAAHRSIAEDVSRHLGIFEAVLASDAQHNLKGQVKLEAIRKAVGGDFAYAGDSRADIPIWEASKAAILVCASKRTGEAIRRKVPIEREFARETIGLAVWLHALRVHQWLKNLLLFVPLLTAFSFMELGKLATMAVAFLAF